MYTITVSRKKLKEFYKKDEIYIDLKEEQYIDVDLLPAVKLLNKVWQYNYKKEKN